jgi:hypothetical protein
MGVDWSHLVQDRAMWWALVNTVHLREILFGEAQLMECRDRKMLRFCPQFLANV